MNKNNYLAHYGVLGMKWGVSPSIILDPDRNLKETKSKKTTRR